MSEVKFSGKEVIKAGESFLDENILNNEKKFNAAMDVLSYWRFTHNEALDNAFTKLQLIVSKKDNSAIFAKRLKRYASIIVKLKRFQSMKLKNMQDIGGCRAVLSSEKKLRQVVRELKKLPEFQTQKTLRYKDYIKTPKDDGYRSYHMVGKFINEEGIAKNIEIQLRTFIQHYWATALEIVDLFTGQALKSNQGEEKWKYFFILVNEQFSIMDNIHMFDTFTKDEKLSLYKNSALSSENITSCKVIDKYYTELKVAEKLTAFANSIKIIENRLNETNSDDFVAGYVLLEIDTKKTTVTSKIFQQSDAQLAEEEYLNIEKESVEIDSRIVALVSTTAVGDIQEAYPNYFADSTKFIEHLNIIIKTMSLDKVIDMQDLTKKFGISSLTDRIHF